MQRCVHLYISGQQCDREAFPGSDFCEDHADVHAREREAEEELQDHPLKKTVMRLAALILLVIFLIPVYYTLKTLYIAAQIEAMEKGG